MTDIDCLNYKSTRTQMVYILHFLNISTLPPLKGQFGIEDIVLKPLSGIYQFIHQYITHELLVIFIKSIYLCISVYMFREVCLSDCLNYEYVHIKTGIDIFTRHKANISQISSTFIKLIIQI